VRKISVKLRLGLITISTILILAWGAACHKQGGSEGPTVDSGDEKQAAAKVAEAETLYAQRADLSKARAAVAVLRAARTADYGNYEAAWKLARAAYFVAGHTDNRDESDDMYREGIAAGKIAVQLQPEKPDGHFWLGANYGGSAENSTLAGLANVQDIRTEMETVLKLDEGYQAGSAYMALGELYLEAPRVLGGDAQKAVEMLEKGLKFGSNNTLLRAYLAQAYEAADRDADARKQIQIIEGMTPDPNFLPEYNDALAKVAKVKEKMNKK
jgi:tetratricopeptide (TPR) repeat protein